jgi:hypothetical protein
VGRQPRSLHVSIAAFLSHCTLARSLLAHEVCRYELNDGNHVICSMREILIQHNQHNNTGGGRT